MDRQADATTKVSPTYSDLLLVRNENESEYYSLYLLKIWQQYVDDLYIFVW
jgi:hypothetical protein